MPDIELRAAGPRRLPAYHAPAVARSGPRPGMVLIHDALGLGDDMRQHADWLAAAGFDVIAPDLFANGSNLVCLPRTIRTMLKRQGPAYDDIGLARRWLLDREDANGRVGVIGFCMGGGFSLVLASRPWDWDASAPNYGLVPKDVDELLATPCPLVASYGGRDRGIPDGAAKIEAAMTRAGVAHDVKEYPDAGHAFMNRIAVRSPMGPLLRVGNMDYRHDDAADAKRRIITFLREHLDTTPAE